MTITMRLDTTGLRALIEDTPEFKIEIQQAVLNNIKQDNIDSAVSYRLDNLLSSMCERTGHWPHRFVVKDAKLIEAITEVVKDQVARISEQRIETLIGDIVQHRTELVKTQLTNHIKEVMIAALTPEMAREILIAKLV